MSRLDLLTVFIVAVCLAALGFLVYKTIQLMNPPEMERSSLESSYDLPEDTTAWLTDDTLSYLDNNEGVTSYDEDKDDEQLGKTLAEEEEAGVKAPATQPKTSTTATQPKTSATGTNTTKPAASASGSSATPRSSATTTAPKTSSSGATATKPAATTPATSTGKYSVVAGSFSKRANADSHAASLRKLGYARTEVVSVGAYASVVVNRYNTLKDAENLVLELRGKGVEAFVKTRQ